MSARRLITALTTTAVLLPVTACRSSGAVHLSPLAGRPSAVAVAGDVVWVADDEAHVVHAIDGATGKVIGKPIGVERNPIALATARNAVWVAHASGTIVRIDTRTRRAGPPIEAGESITGIAAQGQRVWASDLPTNSLVEIDSLTSRIRRVYRIKDGAVRVCAAGAALWVTNRERTATRVDPRTHEIGPTARVGRGPIGLASDGRRVWIANSDDGTISRIHASSGRHLGAPVRVGRGPVGVAIAGDFVWVINQEDETLTRIDPDRGEAVGEPMDLGLRPRGIAAGAGAVWVVGTNPGRLARVDL